MSRRRFFVPAVRRGIAELTGPDAEHLVRVLRAEAGQVYEITDNQNLYLAVIETARKSVVSFRVTEELSSPPQTVAVTLAPALFKFDRFEWLIEKATELRVTTIRPFEGTRSEHGLALASRKRLSRWERIALEASQQSRRLHLPAIEPTVRLPGILKLQCDVRLFLDEESSAAPLLDVLPSLRSTSDHVALMLGPEGGWTDEEKAAAIEAGWVACSLGQTVLRAETAGTAALAIVQSWWGAAETRRSEPEPARIDAESNTGDDGSMDWAHADRQDGE